MSPKEGANLVDLLTFFVVDVESLCACGGREAVRNRRDGSWLPVRSTEERGVGSVSEVEVSDALSCVSICWLLVVCRLCCWRFRLLSIQRWILEILDCGSCLER